MWQLSNLQIDSSVIQIVQSDVLRNSVDTTAAITNTPLPISVFYVYVRGPWYFFTRLLHFTSSKSNRNKARSMPRELWLTTNFGGRPAEAAVAVKFVHKRIPRQKNPRKTGKCGGGGGREVVSDRAYNISPFFTLQVREKECLALQTTHKTRPRVAGRSV